LDRPTIAPHGSIAIYVGTWPSDNPVSLHVRTDELD
jgi:hypothetical protein